MALQVSVGPGNPDPCFGCPYSRRKIGVPQQHPNCRRACGIQFRYSARVESYSCACGIQFRYCCACGIQFLYSCAYSGLPWHAGITIIHGRIGRICCPRDSSIAAIERSRTIASGERSEFMTVANDRFLVLFLLVFIALFFKHCLFGHLPSLSHTSSRSDRQLGA